MLMLAEDLAPAEDVVGALDDVLGPAEGVVCRAEVLARLARHVQLATVQAQRVEEVLAALLEALRVDVKFELSVQVVDGLGLDRKGFCGVRLRLGGGP